MITLPKKIAFVDIETTGGRMQYDRILEIGVLRIENNVLVDTYQTLLNPETYISPFIETLTGISAKTIESAPSFYEIKDRLCEILDDCVFVAHNVRFDYGFIKNELKRCNTSFNPKHFCTVKLSRALFPQFARHNLDEIIERFKITCVNRHRALDDASALWDFYQKAQTQVSENLFNKAVSLALKRPSLPLNIQESDLEDISESPGVYIFYGTESYEKDGKSQKSSPAKKPQEVPLYVGKSINLRDRVLSHFSGDHMSATDMNISHEIKRIETIKTAGELGALFLESSLIKKLQPLYNRKLRLRRRLLILKKITDENGYDSVKLEELHSINTEEISQVLGIFKSKKQAKDMLFKLCKDHSLCQKLLTLEKTKSGCFGYRLGWCKGACVKKETPLSYNIKFLIAFSKTKLKNWPFQGPIFIEEFNALTDSKEFFLLDKWCFLGSIKDDSEVNSLSRDYSFDYDTYKILHSYLKLPQNLRKVRELERSQYANLFTSLPST